MDLKQLQRFVMVADRQSFACAAKDLNVSQPALTRSIQMLEETVDASLFERGPRGVVLTPAGSELLQRAKAILNERDRAMTAIATVKRDRTHRLTVGALPRLSSTILCNPLLALSDENPELEVRIVEESLAGLLIRLRENQIEFCFGPRGDITDLRDITFEPLVTQRAILVTRADHPLHHRTEVRFADLCAERWIVLDSADTRAQWRTMFLRRELSIPKSVIWAQSWDMMQGLLLAGDCIMTCGSLAISRHLEAGGLAELRVDREPFVSISGLFTPQHRPQSRMALDLMQRVREYCRQLAPPESLASPES